MSTKLISPEFRGSFVALVEPQGIKGDPDSVKKYQMLLSLPKDHKWWKKVEKMVNDAAIEKWGKVPPRLKSPIKDGDASGYDNLVGSYTLNCSNKRRPGLVDAEVEPLMDTDVLYSGAWYRASINAYAWEHPTGGKGVSINLNNVMWIRHDEPFDGSADAETDFQSFKDDGDDDGESLLD